MRRSPLLRLAAPFAAALALSLTPAAAAAPAPNDAPPYEAWAAELAEALGVDTRAPLDYDATIARFAHLDLGRFRVLVGPDSLADSDAHERFQRAAGALLELQVTWDEWSTPARAKATAKQVKKLRALLAKSRAKAFVELAPHADLAATIAPRERDRELFTSLATTLRDGDEPVLLALFPSRVDLLAFASLAGTLEPSARAAFWQPGMATWATCFWRDLMGVALQYGSDGSDPLRGLSQDWRSKTGIEEQVVRVAGELLVEAASGARFDPAIGSGVAIDLGIELYGGLNSRSDGDTRTRNTVSFSVFVPGGNPDGGALPALSADSRWRDGGGGDRFLAALKRAQSAGAEERGDVRHFELMGDNGSGQHTVAAPFLGSAAATKPLPPERFRGDYLEFYRSYRSAFAYWLRTRAGGKRKASQQAFARLMAEVEGGTAFEAALETVYEEPLHELELEFLGWLPKGR